MKKLSVTMAAALALGMLAAPAAQAGCDPVYDPGSACPGKFVLNVATTGGEARAEGTFVEHSAAIRRPSYLKDTADDGLDVHLWVLYGRYDGDLYQEQIAVASGPGATTDVEWTTPAGMLVDWFQVRVCVGPDEANCSRWAG